MRCDVIKLKAARERRAMTQEKLAAESRVDIRTIQRAEAGAALRQDTVADIAAVLGMPLSGILAPREAEEDTVATLTAGLTLKRVKAAREVIELLERSRLAKLDCDVDPSPEIIETLKGTIHLLEALLPDPWDRDGTGTTLIFNSLVDRLEKMATLTSFLGELDRLGLGLYAGSSWLSAKMPHWSEEGWAVWGSSPIEGVRAARLLISGRMSDRVTVPEETTWTVEIVEEIPF